MTQAEFDRILERYINDTATAKEKLLVEKWFEAMGQQSSELGSEEIKASREKLWKEIEPNPEKPVRSLFLKIAAAFVLLMVVIGISNKMTYERKHANDLKAPQITKTIANHSDATKKIDLLDGSYVILQPHASIQVPLTFGKTREVTLKGEAFFQVAKDASRPFLVYTNEVTTKVLGTSFIIKANESDPNIIVSVKTGHVSVLTPAKNEKNTIQEIVLSPNQQVIYDRNENAVVRKIVDDPRIIAEHSTLKSAYVNEPVAKIFAALEMSYGIDIQFDEKILSECTLTSDMSEVGLYERIDIICNAIGATYTTVGVTVIIDAKPCH